MTKLVKIFALTIATLLCAFPKVVRADQPVVSSSAQLSTVLKVDEDDFDSRCFKLKKFLSSYNSPLSLYAEEFVKAADKYELDWRMVPAITGVESTFGKRIPHSSYNAYGWANGEYKFSSWENSIEIVSKTLKEKYYNNGAININRVANRYAPPSKTWSWKVKFFMNKIDSVPVEFDI